MFPAVVVLGDPETFMEETLWKRIKGGAENLTPLQLINAKRIGLIGQCVGVVFGMIVLGYNGFWFFQVFLFFTLIVLLVELVSVHQQLLRMEKLGGN